MKYSVNSCKRKKIKISSIAYNGYHYLFAMGNSQEQKLDIFIIYNGKIILLKVSILFPKFFLPPLFTSYFDKTKYMYLCGQTMLIH